MAKGDVIAPTRELREGGLPRSHVAAFGLAALVLLALFQAPLRKLVDLAWHSDLYSHILLIPFVSLYLAWIRIKEGPAVQLERSGAWALSSFACGVVFLGLVLASGWIVPPDDLFFMTAAFVLWLVAVLFLLFGRNFVALICLPLVLLVFMLPFPRAVEDGIEVGLQHASAEAAAFFFRLAGIPLFQDGLTFRLPNIVLAVARECSGIRSTLILLITSFIAGCLFLRRPSSRLVLFLAVIPLAVVRNGFRIFIIGMLCVKIDPSMINSWVHRRGGPFFFLLSLVPFFGLIMVLRRADYRSSLSERAGGTL